jgi:ribonuclease III
MLELEKFEEKIKFKFKNQDLLKLALTHKSYGYEHNAHLAISIRDNERLEFLGDAILDLVISEMLFQHYKNVSEGELSKYRASIVNETVLAKIARNLHLNEFLFLGKGEEQTDGRNKDSILSSAFEALVAAIYLDKGFDAIKDWVQIHFKDLVKLASKEKFFSDYKTKLQEYTQSHFKTAPRYEVIHVDGPDHERIYTVALFLGDKKISEGLGKSKKEAEQKAAELALEILC